MDNELLLGGYVLTTPTTIPSMQLLPAPFQTISNCLMDDAPQPGLIDWFTDRDEAESGRASSQVDLQLIAVGLRSADAAVLIEELAYEDEATDLAFRLLNQRKPLPTEASFLGYELIGVEPTLSFHSWHCHYYLPDAQRLLGIRVNRLGLFDHYSDARHTLDWMRALPFTEAPAPVPWTVAGLALS